MPSSNPTTALVKFNFKCLLTVEVQYLPVNIQSRMFSKSRNKSGLLLLLSNDSANLGVREDLTVAIATSSGNETSGLLSQ